MRHCTTITKCKPLPAFYYQLSLTQKIMELATIASFADSAIGAVKNLLNARQQ